MDIKLKVKGLIGRLFPSLKPKDAKVYIKALRGKYGLEIGGPSPIFVKKNILPLYPCIKSLDGCNFATSTIWEGQINEGNNYIYDKSKPPGFQYILEASQLASIENEKYDFCLASHVLEHTANTIKALKEWIRVVKNEGYLLVVVPHREGTFDHKRKVNMLRHLISDYEKDTGEDDRFHLPEILELHDLSMDKAAGNFQSFKARSLDNFNNRCLHQHVFDTSLIIRLFDYLKLQICKVDAIKPYHIIVLGKKCTDSRLVKNTIYLSPVAEWKKRSPFLSDKK